MRILVDLCARRDAEYTKSYHHKLRGCLWRPLENTRFEEMHESSDPVGYSFSNIFPWGEIEEGDERNLLVASTHEDLLANVAAHYEQGTEMNVGEMPFTVEGYRPLGVDVGEPGTTGTLETATGVVVRFDQERRQEYNIEDDHGDTVTYWKPEHGIKSFREAISGNLQHKHDLFAPDYLPGPENVEGQLFDGMELIKTYALPVEVTSGVERTIILSKWRFEYRVRDDDHHRHLNLALDTGIGGRNGMGFGFLNRVNHAG